MLNSCPACRSSHLTLFYAVDDVPAHSVLLLTSRQEAVDYPTAVIRLAFCEQCGFITNTAFDPTLHEYSARYEETQGFSPTFNAFHHRLAQGLIERYDLRRKNIIEIGCGKGEFLALLCELGDNRGIGFDPAYVAGRLPDARLHDGRLLDALTGRLTFVKDFYSDQYADVKGDFICCKMTLEHIHNVADFMATVRRAATANPDATLFFQLPDTARILRDLAFWDIYYEHCSYFTLGSLARLFRHSGFQVIELWQDYEDQYLMITAKAGADPFDKLLPGEDDLAQTRTAVANFSARYPQQLAGWRESLQAMKADGRRVVLWGGGSKGVAFLTTLGVTLDQIEYVVDVNPYKAGSYMAGSGQEVVPPLFLQTYRPDVVIIMNPIYRSEIQRTLDGMDLCPELITIEQFVGEGKNGTPMTQKGADSR
jgi:SAM-dependent methyltransferase